MMLAALVTLTLTAVLFGLLARQSPGGADLHGETGIIALSTPGGGSTPALPAFTIGVWTSTTTPATGESITIFILCMTQDPTRGGPLGPAGGVQVRVRLSGGMTQSLTGITSGDGLAQIPVRFTPARPDQPVTIDAVTTWRGVTYQGQTFLMAGAGEASSPTPAPSASLTPTPATSPTPAMTPTPSPAPSPAPSPTPAAKPTPISTPTPTQ